jgi:hypothetical protein
MKRRLIGLLLIALFVVSGCARSNTSAEPVATGGKYGSGVDTDFGDEKKAAAQTAAPAAGAPTRRPGTGGGSVTQPTFAPSRPAGPVKASTLARDRGIGGQNALAYLRDRHSKLVVEINAVEGREPSQSSLDLLKQRLTEVCSKPGGIEFQVKTIPSQGRSQYTMGEVKALEQRYRKQWSDATGPKVVMHMLYLNGRVTDSNGIGIAYGASSIVMLPDQFESAATPIASAERIEQAVIVHEVGHLLGLVNIGYKSPRDHEDAEHPHHSKNKGSVMFWAVDSLDIASLLAGGIPTAYDGDDKADLRDRKAGKI